MLLLTIKATITLGTRDVWKIWETVEHLEELLSRPAQLNPPDIEAAPTDFPIDATPPTPEEMRMTIRQINNGKRVGLDILPAKALKSDIEANAKMFHVLFRNIWEEQQMPTYWKEGHLTKIPKKGDLSKCGNYRGITLRSVPLCKLFRHYGVPEKNVNILNLYNGLHCNVVHRGQLTDAFQVKISVRKVCILSLFLFWCATVL
ncbi:unnamed protein product [Schistosoma curassoni]|uniref:Asp_Arg_Hydrox domain-containing protein n=1 Tax=Schistosoma curassoni TaxID=6186 RepID=A0A183KZ33_9TREM|nr:unnamed protein product [Schistosoma curassoni]